MTPPGEDFAGLGRFGDVDATGEQEMFVRFLEEVEAQPSVQALRVRTYELLEVRPGALVADVGCGLGTAARDLAARGARVLAFDASTAMVEEARRRTDAADVSFDVGDAASLPLDAGVLAGYRAERLYQHVEDPAAAIREARRVLAPGGRAVVADQDYDTFLIDADDPELGRAVVRAFGDSIRHPWMGRRHRSLLLDAGFEDVAVVPRTLVYTESDFGELLASVTARAAGDAGMAVEGWLEEQRERLANDRFFASLTVFVAVGRAPGR